MDKTLDEMKKAIDELRTNYKSNYVKNDTHKNALPSTLLYTLRQMNNNFKDIMICTHKKDHDNLKNPILHKMTYKLVLKTQESIINNLTNDDKDIVYNKIKEVLDIERNALYTSEKEFYFDNFTTCSEFLRIYKKSDEEMIKAMES
jgi:hypothetical protein